MDNQSTQWAAFFVFRKLHGKKHSRISMKVSFHFSVKLTPSQANILKISENEEHQ